MNRVARATLGAVVTITIFALTAEAAVRVFEPMPRMQVVRGGAQKSGDVAYVRQLNGQPVWEHSDSEKRQDPGCADDATDVVMLGSSILWGTGYKHDQVVSHHLQERLGEDWCVRNHAQPAFVGKSKLAVAQAVIPEFKPEVVVWEVWANDNGGFSMVGEDAYNLETLVTDDHGYPVLSPVGVPGPLHRTLFEYSQLWWYLTLTFPAREPGAYETSWRELVDETLPEVKRLTEAHGGQLVLVYMPFLDRTFEESVTFENEKMRGYQWTRAWADAHDVAQVHVARSWVDKDHEALRHDPCCHYAPAGHAELAALLEPTLRAVAAPAEGEEEADAP